MWLEKALFASFIVTYGFVIYIGARATAGALHRMRDGYNDYR